MEEIQPQKHNYELAFHINPDLAETKVQEVKQALDSSITSMGGSISFSKDPEKTRLSYPVQHHNASYFGYIQFSLSDLEKLEQFRNQLQLNGDIFRYLVLKLESDVKREAHLAQRAKIQEKRMERKSKAKAAEKKAPPEKAAKEEKILEEQIEDVIEKL